MVGGQYVFNSNLQKKPDPSHAGTRDFYLAPGSAQLKGFWMCMVISWNLPFGLDAEENRNAQLRSCMASCFKEHKPHHKPHEVPLFLSLCPKLYEMFERRGVQFDGDLNIEQQVWDAMIQRQAFKTRGRKCNMARFHSALSTGVALVPNWWADSFERTYTGIEFDCVATKNFAEKLKARPTADETDPEAGPSTSSSRLNFEKKTLLGSCKNAIGVSVWMLNNVNNERICQVVVTLSEDLRLWHEDQNRRLRSADGNEEWIVEQIGNDEYYDHINSIVGRFKPQAAMSRMGFVTDGLMAAACDRGDMVLEDDFAEMAFTFGMSLASLRCRRGM